MIRKLAVFLIHKDQLITLHQWFCHPCILRPWRIKILKDTEQLKACADQSKKLFLKNALFAWFHLVGGGGGELNLTDG